MLWIKLYFLERGTVITTHSTIHSLATITIGIGAQFEGEEAKYQILAIAKDTP